MNEAYNDNIGNNTFKWEVTGDCTGLGDCDYYEYVMFPYKEPAEDFYWVVPKGRKYQLFTDRYTSEPVEVFTSLSKAKRYAEELWEKEHGGYEMDESLNENRVGNGFDTGIYEFDFSCPNGVNVYKDIYNDLCDEFEPENVGMIERIDYTNYESEYPNVYQSSIVYSHDEDENIIKEMITDILANYGAVIEGEDWETLGESLNEDNLNPTIRKEIKNQYRGYQHRTDRQRKENKDFLDIIKNSIAYSNVHPERQRAFTDSKTKEDDIKKYKELKKKWNDKIPKFKYEIGRNIEKEDYPFYVTVYDKSATYEPAEGGYYVEEIDAAESAGYNTYEEAKRDMDTYIEESGENFEPCGKDCYEWSTKYVGEGQIIRIETNKNYLKGESHYHGYESFDNNKYKSRKKPVKMNEGKSENLIDTVYSHCNNATEDKEYFKNRYEKKGYKNIRVKKVKTDTKGLPMYEIYGDKEVNESLKESWMDHLSNDVYRRLANCTTTREDIPELVNAKWYSYKENGKADKGFTKEDALVAVLELLDCNGIDVDLDMDDYNELKESLNESNDDDMGYKLGKWLGARLLTGWTAMLNVDGAEESPYYDEYDQLFDGTFVQCLNKLKEYQDIIDRDGVPAYLALQSSHGEYFDGDYDTIIDKLYDRGYLYEDDMDESLNESKNTSLEEIKEYFDSLSDSRNLPDYSEWSLKELTEYYTKLIKMLKECKRRVKEINAQVDEEGTRHIAFSIADALASHGYNYDYYDFNDSFDSFADAVNSIYDNFDKDTIQACIDDLTDEIEDIKSDPAYGGKPFPARPLRKKRSDYADWKKFRKFEESMNESVYKYINKSLKESVDTKGICGERVEFKSGEEMLDAINSGSDFYNVNTGDYVFGYNDNGSIAVYYLDLDEATDLQNKCGGDYWGGYLGPGGYIYDDESYEGRNEYAPTNKEFCDDNYANDGWVELDYSCGGIDESLNEFYDKGWQETGRGWSSDTYKVAEKVQEFLKDNDIWVDISGYDPDTGEFSLEISGDWKHEHLRADWLIKEQLKEVDGYRIAKIGTYSLEDSEDDSYRGVHQYRIINIEEENKNRKEMQERRKKFEDSLVKKEVNGREVYVSPDGRMFEKGYFISSPNEKEVMWFEVNESLNESDDRFSNGTIGEWNPSDLMRKVQETGEALNTVRTNGDDTYYISIHYKKWFGPRGIDNPDEVYFTDVVKEDANGKQTRLLSEYGKADAIVATLNFFKKNVLNGEDVKDAASRNEYLESLNENDSCNGYQYKGKTIVDAGDYWFVKGYEEKFPTSDEAEEFIDDMKKDEGLEDKFRGPKPLRSFDDVLKAKENNEKLYYYEDGVGNDDNPVPVVVAGRPNKFQIPLARLGVDEPYTFTIMDFRNLSRDKAGNLDKLANESMKINIRESLNKMDAESDNTYDLLNLYESKNLSKRQKKDIARMIYENYGLERIYNYLYEATEEEDELPVEDRVKELTNNFKNTNGSYVFEEVQDANKAVTILKSRGYEASQKRTQDGKYRVTANKK